MKEGETESEGGRERKGEWEMEKKRDPGTPALKMLVVLWNDRLRCHPAVPDLSRR